MTRVNANLKNVSSNYLKAESNTIWGRKGKEKGEDGEPVGAEVATPVTLTELANRFRERKVPM